MKILILHRYPLEQAKETNGSIIFFLQKLLSKNFKVDFLSFDDLNQSSKKNIIGVNFKKIKYTINRGKASDKLLKSILWCFLSPYFAYKLNKINNYNIIYCDDSFPLYPAIVKIFCKNASVFMRLGDLQTGYIFSSNNFLTKVLFIFFHSIEKTYWRYMDGLIPISEEFKKYILKSGVKSKKICVVPESFEDSILKKSNYYPVKKKFNIDKNKKIVLFHGSIEKTKGLRYLLDAILILNLKKSHNLHFLIVGSGSELKKLNNYAKLKKIENTTFTGWINFSKISSIINQSKFCIVLREKSLANKFILTMAFIQYAINRKPIIAPSLGEIKRLGKKYNSVSLFIPSSSKSLANKIELMSEKLKSSKLNSYKLQSMVKREYHGKKVAKKLYESILKLKYE